MLCVEGTPAPSITVWWRIRVAIFQVPPQLLSECLYPIMSLIPHNGRRSHSSQTGGKDTQPSPCGNCGTVHLDYFLCPAAHRKCYSCRRYGHYAQFCPVINNTRVSQPDNICDSGTQPAEVSVLASKAPEQPLNSEVEDLKKLLAQCQAENVKLKERCAALEAQNTELSRKVDTLSTTSAELEKEKCKFENQFKVMFKQAANLVQSSREYEHLKWHQQDEFEKLASTCRDPYWPYPDPCRFCGAWGHFTPDRSCPALGWQCLKCNLTGHFASTCKYEYPIVDYLPETDLIFRTFSETYGIELEPRINCDCGFDDSDCDDDY